MTVAVLYDKLLGKHHLFEIDELTISNQELYTLGRILIGKHTVFYGLVHCAEWEGKRPEHLHHAFFNKLAYEPTPKRGRLVSKIRTALNPIVLQEFKRLFPTWQKAHRVRKSAVIHKTCQTLFG